MKLVDFSNCTTCQGKGTFTANYQAYRMVNGEKEWFQKTKEIDCSACNGLGMKRCWWPS